MKTLREMMDLIESAQAGVAEGLNDTQKKIEDTINKLEDRLKHAKTDEQWDNIKNRIERLQAGLKRSKQGVAEGSKYKCSCHPGDPDPDCPVHGLEPMEVGDALDVKKGVAEAKSDDPDYDETLKRFKKGLPPKKKQDVAEEQVEESTPDAMAKIDDLFRK